MLGTRAFASFAVCLLVLGAGCTAVDIAKTTGWEPQGVERDPGVHAVSVNETTFNSSRIEEHVYEEVNNYRAKHDLDPLERDDKYLATVARAHSYDMGENDYLDHVNPDGENPVTRYEQAEFHHVQPCDRYGENIIKIPYDGTGDIRAYSSNERIAELALSRWASTDEHDAVLLRDEWDRTGVGVYVPENETELYITQTYCATPE